MFSWAYKWAIFHVILWIEEYNRIYNYSQPYLKYWDIIKHRLIFTFSVSLLSSLYLVLILCDRSPEFFSLLRLVSSVPNIICIWFSFFLFPFGLYWQIVSEARESIKEIEMDGAPSVTMSGCRTACDVVLFNSFCLRDH